LRVSEPHSAQTKTIAGLAILQTSGPAPGKRDEVHGFKHAEAGERPSVQ